MEVAPMIIDIDELKKAKQANKTLYNQTLLKQMESLKPGKAIILNHIGAVKKEDRRKISEQIRKHWKHLSPSHNPSRTKISIRYTPENIPRISIRRS